MWGEVRTLSEELTWMFKQGNSCQSRARYEYRTRWLQKENFILFYFIFIYLFLSFFAISWPAPVGYGGSQARGPIGAVVAGLHQSHSNAGSEPRLRLIPQLTAKPDLKRKILNAEDTNQVVQR